MQGRPQGPGDQTPNLLDPQLCGPWDPTPPAVTPGAAGQAQRPSEAGGSQVLSSQLPWENMRTAIPLLGPTRGGGAWAGPGRQQRPNKSILPNPVPNTKAHPQRACIPAVPRSAHQSFLQQIAWVPNLCTFHRPPRGQSPSAGGCCPVAGRGGWRQSWTEWCPAPKSYVEALPPSTSECSYIWRQYL